MLVHGTSSVDARLVVCLSVRHTLLLSQNYIRNNDRIMRFPRSDSQDTLYFHTLGSTPTEPSCEGFKQDCGG